MLNVRLVDEYMCRIKRNYCVVCAEIKPRSLKSPENFLNCLDYFKQLLASGSFECVYSNFELEHPQDKQGSWQSDMLLYTIRCKDCGQKYCCSADTYHGHASLEVLK